jgi:hypothetical protein
MFNLYEILRSAQGGQALDNLAAQFNITAEEADAAVKAVLPALSERFLKQASEPAAFGSFVGALGEGQHLAAFTDPAAAQASAQAPESLSQILGSSSTREEIALRASSATGLSQDLISQMLPVIASMIFGGLAKSMQNQGFGSILGQLANAAGQGGLGSILGQVLGGAPTPGNPQPQPLPAPGPAGGLGGLGTILGKILGAGQGATGSSQAPSAAPGQLGGILGSILAGFARRPGTGSDTGPAAGPSPPAGAPQMPGFDTASIQASLEALTKMLQPGTPPPASEQPTPQPPASQPSSGIDINAELNRIMSSKRE